MKKTIYHNDINFIVDEAQSTYEGCDLWNSAIKDLSGRSKGMKIILFSASGSPTIGYLDAPQMLTPALLGPSQRVYLATRNDPRTPPIGLFCAAELDVMCELSQLSGLGLCLSNLLVRSVCFILPMAIQRTVGEVLKARPY
jgi:hypothetical protein